MPPRMIETDMPFTVFANEADCDYLLARMISSLGGSFAARAGFMAHQACEKYMKAVLVQDRRCYPQSHKLLEIADLCVAVDPFFSEAGPRTTLKNFDRFEQVGRYGGAANHDPLSVRNESMTVVGVTVWYGSYIDDLDEFVFKVRGMLDWTTVSHRDQLQAILDRDMQTSIMSRWTGDQPIDSVLTTGNRFFKKSA